MLRLAVSHHILPLCSSNLPGHNIYVCEGRVYSHSQTDQDLERYLFKADTSVFVLDLVGCIHCSKKTFMTLKCYSFIHPGDYAWQTIHKSMIMLVTSSLLSC